MSSAQNSNSENPNSEKQPSMLSGHAAYAKGYVEESVCFDLIIPSLYSSGKSV